MHLPEKKIQLSLCPFWGAHKSLLRAVYMAWNPKALPDFTAWTSLSTAGFSLPLLHSIFETCSFMRKIKDLCWEPHWMPCGFVCDFYSTDRQSSSPFQEDIKPNFCLWLFYETCRKLIFRESLAHWCHLTDGYTDTEQTQGLQEPEIPEESS